MEMGVCFVLRACSLLFPGLYFGKESLAARLYIGQRSHSRNYICSFVICQALGTTAVCTLKSCVAVRAGNWAKPRLASERVQRFAEAGATETVWRLTEEADRWMDWVVFWLWWDKQAQR